MSQTARYDKIGEGYALTRREDPHIAQAIRDALGDARSVVNVGAGTGSYEPADRYVIAVEPSDVMAAQRPPTIPPATPRKRADLPLRDNSTDAAMALRHDPSLGRRAGTRDPGAAPRCPRYRRDPHLRSARQRRDVADGRLPARSRRAGPAHLPARPSSLAEWLGGRTRIEVVPIPRDTPDWMLGSFWAHPERVLDERARNATSGFARMDASVVERVVRDVRRDLESGAWDERHGHLRELDAFDAGLAPDRQHHHLTPPSRASSRSG